MRNLSLIVSLIISFHTLASSRGEVSFDLHRYTKEKSGQNNQLIFTSVEVQDSLKLFGNTLYLGLSAKANEKDKKSSYINVDDFYYSVNLPKNTRVEAGYRIYNWTKMESLRPTDVVNSRILDGDLENFDKRGELSLNLEKDTEYGLFKFYLFPLFQKSFFPSDSSRISDGVSPSKHRVVTNNGIEDKKSFFQYGVSYEKQFGDLEIFAFYLRHIDRNRVVIGYNDYTSVPNVGNIPQETLGAYYFDTSDFGFSSTYFIEDHTLKLELLNTVYHNDDITFLTAAGLRKTVDYTTMALGHEYGYTWENGWDSTSFIEYQTLLGVDKQTRQELSIFQNDLFVGHRLSLNDAYSKQITLGVFFDIERSSEFIVDFSYDQRLNNFWNIDVGYRGFNHNEGDKLGIYVFKNDNEFYLSLTRFF